jgi:hypothetical protein
MNKRDMVFNIRESGDFLEGYPTDSFDGSNSGDGELWFWKDTFWEINKERGGTKVILGKITNPQQIKILKKKWMKSIIANRKTFQ